ncbi:hypothetical protein scyTo_0020046 [Scyliorhinus torazame]|uniref:THIF-type NAD/FAD binding fold domain-containing protein n=1 Tax=Scyliorhinus torazame TaxID=75743 RepID=A0A401PXV7_SCYTO|nr:hypothetical protein [Scyliorhinus torazame]
MYLVLVNSTTIYCYVKYFYIQKNELRAKCNICHKGRVLSFICEEMKESDPLTDSGEPPKKMAAGNMEIDDSLYSRQRYVLGDNAMYRMAESHVFLSGIGGLGIEIGKLSF